MIDICLSRAWCFCDWGIKVNWDMIQTSRSLQSGGRDSERSQWLSYSVKYYNRLETPQSQDLCLILLYLHPAPSSLPGREQEHEYLMRVWKSIQARWCWGYRCGAGAKSARGGAERKGEASGSLKVVFEVGIENWRISRSGAGKWRGWRHRDWRNRKTDKSTVSEWWCWWLVCDGLSRFGWGTDRNVNQLT